MLEQILDVTRRRTATLNESELRAQASDLPPARPFQAALAAPGVSIIAEIKRRSPSRGELAGDLDPATQAGVYEAGGAAAISVLTEPEFFSGSLDDLAAVRGSVSLPVLRKDFILTTAQLWETRAAGADAVLLIVAALSHDDLAGLLNEAEAAGLAALVEVHTAAEAGQALAAGAQIIGVNNRDLGTFTVDLATAEMLAPILQGVAVRVAESGIFTGADARRMAAVGYNAVLVGEALVTSDDAARLVGELRGVVP
ncbi:MAG: indole-3-glycerol phosphate synthase TrpC [Acidimicrobiia bacterium]|nr:indole-3-glycerol phosphate synthase TrpC [Acidimicrobiia bacterium]